MTSPNPLMAHFAGEPCLVEPTMAGRVESCLAQVLAHPKAQEMLSGELLMCGDFWQEDGGWCRPYVVADGILQIPVKGVLLNNFPYQLYDWATGYEYIWQAFRRGCADFAIGAIKGIAFISDSPGGVVAGCWDNHDRMVALKEETKVPVWAFAHEAAYSAAYGTICFADKIAVSRTGGVGSIGTVTGHLDRSGAMEKAGLVFTYIASDPSKVEGNSYEPLSPDAKARIQVRIDELNDIFVAAVSRSRGLSEDVIRNDLKAYSYTATQATSNGLADSIGSLDDATAAFAAFLDDLLSEEDGDETMTTPVAAVDQAAIDTAVAAARTEGEQAGAVSGATAERQRITAIKGSDEAQKRPAAAESVAMNTAMSVDDAKAFLATLPEEAKVVVPAPDASGAQTPFDAAMRGNNPNVGGGDVGAEGEDTEASKDGADIIALARQFGIAGVRPAAA